MTVEDRMSMANALEDPQARLLVEPIFQFFADNGSGYPAPETTAIHGVFRSMAKRLILDLPRNPERTVALRKLMEARDCAMRAAVMK
jgi:hypothetical protein